VLRGVKYEADGSVVVTDRHRLLRIADAHSFAEPFVADAKTGALIEGTYPDTSRIIPSEAGTTDIMIIGTDIKALLQGVKLAVGAAKLAGVPTKLITLQIVGGTYEIKAQYNDNSVDLRLRGEGVAAGEDLTVSCNAEYLLDAINVFVDAGTSKLTIDFYGKTHPIILRDKQNGIEAVVLPYRVSAE